MWRSVIRKAELLYRFLSVNNVKSVKCRSHGSSCRVTEKTWMRPDGFDTGLKTFNSLTKQKEPLILAKEGTATWYGA